ncbi:unnamed protein product [Durusdinium trenchii]|uniref:Uncharacterized protein n=2 Tax=Durusdinium trenchii TaxID=1381693 RepID=A0ABP0L8I7_9DINO|eukprot:g23398.t1
MEETAEDAVDIPVGTETAGGSEPSQAEEPGTEEPEAGDGEAEEAKEPVEPPDEELSGAGEAPASEVAQPESAGATTFHWPPELPAADLQELQGQPPQSAWPWVGSAPSEFKVWDDFRTAFKQYMVHLAGEALQNATPELDPRQRQFAAAALGGHGSGKVCFNYLNNACTRGGRCVDQHPPRSQWESLRQELKRKSSAMEGA